MKSRSNQFMLIVLLIFVHLCGCKDETNENDGLKVYDEIKEIYFDSKANEVILKFDKDKVFSFHGYTAIDGQDTVRCAEIISSLDYSEQGKWYEFKITKDNIYVKVTDNPRDYERFIYFRLPNFSDLTVLSIIQAGISN